MKVAIVLGTRPQIIKSAPVYHALVAAGVGCQVVNTGQHYDYEMNREFFSELELPDPAADLNVGKGTPAAQVGEIIRLLGAHFEQERPDLAVVPGDTNSALAAGIACSKAGVASAHLESGCRSYEMEMAEEVNRRVLDHTSQVLLCPTRHCVQNVRAERVLAETVSFVGDTMRDSVLKYLPSVSKLDITEKYEVEKGSYVFMTLHRAEAVDVPQTLKSILDGMSGLGTRVVFSVHPRTKARMEEFGILPPKNVTLVGPLPYIDTLALAKGSEFVATDSGGLQKEAFWLGRPMLILRDRTEWVEIVKAGGAVVAGTKKDTIRAGLTKVRKIGTAPFKKASAIFGDGRAADKVAKVLLSARR